jgi:uncharacterized membrane protein
MSGAPAPAGGAASARRRRWAHVAALVAVAVAVHALAVWAVPRLIMSRVLGNAAQLRDGGVYLPPMTDHRQRAIVMPSPDLLYALCAFDLRDRPMRVRARPDAAPGYWSIALYASNSDNFFVVNDRQAVGGAVDLLLVGPGAPAPAGGSARVVRSPTDRGLLLMRVLVDDYAAQRVQVEAARRALSCAPA